MRLMRTMIVLAIGGYVFAKVLPRVRAKARVVKAREIQQKRFAGRGRTSCNARMSSRDIKSYCAITEGTLDLLKSAMSDMGLSARAYDRILKVARTIADLVDADKLGPDHVSEAISYRTLDRQWWG